MAKIQSFDKSIIKLIKQSEILPNCIAAKFTLIQRIIEPD